MNKKQFTRRSFIKTAALALPVVAAGCGSISKPVASAGDFVTIRNRRFERRDQPYFFGSSGIFREKFIG